MITLLYSQHVFIFANVGIRKKKKNLAKESGKKTLLIVQVL